MNSSCVASLDIDGCLGIGIPEDPSIEEYDMSALDGLKKYGRRIFLNTGRELSATRRIADYLRVPAVLEHGMRIYANGMPIDIEDLFPEYRNCIELLRRVGYEIDTSGFKKMPKDRFFAYIVPDGVHPEDFQRAVRGSLNGLGSYVDRGDIIIKPSKVTVDVRASKITKAVGTRAMARLLGHNGPILAVDDADTDPFQNAYFIGCPANATEPVKARVVSLSKRGHVSQKYGIDGTLEILERFLGD